MQWRNRGLLRAAADREDRSPSMTRRPASPSEIAANAARTPRSPASARNQVTKSVQRVTSLGIDQRSPRHELPVEIVLHDRAVAAGAVALEREDVACRSLRRASTRRSRRDRPRSVERVMSATLAARCARLRAPTITAATIGRSSMARLATVAMSRTVAVGDPAERPQQCLEQRPAAEIVDDQLVFGERAVLEGRLRLRRAEPAVAEEPAGDRAVAEKLDAVPPAEVDQPVLRPSVEQRILHLHGWRAATPAATSSAVRGVSKFVPPRRSILPSRCSSSSQPRALETARHGVVPPVELDEVEPLQCRAAAATCR